MITTWRERLAQALKEGYAGMRVNGNGIWLPGQDWTEFLSYEAALGESLANLQLLFLCTYPLATTSASQLFDLARLCDD